MGGLINKKCLSLLILLIITPFVFGETSMHFLTRGLADTLYCSINGCSMMGDLDMNGYSILNGSWINMTYYNASTYCLGGSCISSWAEVNQTSTNCNVTGSCNTIAYLDYANSGNLNISDNFFVGGNSYFDGDLFPFITLLYDIGSGANRWDWLYVRNVSAENIETYTLHSTENISSDEHVCDSVGCIGDVNLSSLNDSYWNIGGDTGISGDYVGNYDLFMGSGWINTSYIDFGSETLPYKRLLSYRYPMDGFIMEYQHNFEAVNDDWLILKKSDGNDGFVDGGIGIVFQNVSGDNRTVLKIDGYGLANFTTYNVSAYSFFGDGSQLTGISDTGNCSVSGSCPSVAYLNYINNKNFSLGSNYNLSVNRISGILRGGEVIIDSKGYNNMFLGYQSSSTGLTGTGINSPYGGNTCIGDASCAYLTTGFWNTCIGTSACTFLTTGRENMALGQGALYGASYPNTASLNAAIGRNSMGKITSGVQNVANGYYSLYNVGTGSYNVALGHSALYNNSGNYNTAIGYYAGYNSYKANNSVFIGHNAGYNEHGSNTLYIHNNETSNPLVYGNFNTRKLKINGDLNVTGLIYGNGSQLTGISSVGNCSVAGSCNNILYSDYDNNKLFWNSSAKKFSINTLTQTTNFEVNGTARINKGTGNLLLGLDSGNAANLSAATYNVCVGDYTCARGATWDGDYNVIEGYGAGQNSGGSFNTLLGYYAGNQLTTGTSNNYIGYKSGSDGTNTGAFNVGVGPSSLRANKNGNYNIGIGDSSLKGLFYGDYNTFVGPSSGVSLTGNSGANNNAGFGYRALYKSVEGNNNVALGFEAGYNSTGSNNIFLGYKSGFNEVGNNNLLYIHNNETSSPLIYGNFTSRKLTVNGEINITGKTTSTDYYSGDGSQGITNTTGFWLCKASDCSSTCQVQIKDGLITGCV